MQRLNDWPFLPYSTLNSFGLCFQHTNVVDRSLAYHEEATSHRTTSLALILATSVLHLELVFVRLQHPSARLHSTPYLTSAFAYPLLYPRFLSSMVPTSHPTYVPKVDVRCSLSTLTPLVTGRTERVSDGWDVSNRIETTSWWKSFIEVMISVYHGWCSLVVSIYI